MSIVDALTDAHGIFALRFQIEGWPYEFVSHPQMARFTADGRQRLACLIAEGIDYGHLCDGAFQELDGDAPTITIAEPDDPTLSGISVLGKIATSYGYLSGETDDSTTTPSFTSTAGSPSVGDVVHVGKEAMRVDSLSPFTVTRGMWDTFAHYHHQVNNNASNSIYPLVFDVPVSMEGRRCSLHLYAGSDSVNTDYEGRQIWRGYVIGGPQYDGRGLWKIPLGRLDELYKKPISKGLGEAVAPRGVHHDSGSSDFGVSAFIRTPLGASSSAVLDMSPSFWETQTSFLSSLTSDFSTDLAAATDVTSKGLAAIEGVEVDENLAHPSGGLADVGSWCLKITIDQACDLYFTSGSGNNGKIEPVFTTSSGYEAALFDSGKNYVDTIDAPNGYSFSGAGTFYVVAHPSGHESLEGAFGDAAPHPGGGLVPRRAKGLTFYASRVYSVGVDPAATNEGTQLRVKSPDDENYSNLAISSYDHTLGRIVLSSAETREYTPFYATEYNTMVAYGWNTTKTIGDIVSSDFSNFALQALPGDCPPFYTDDIQDFDTETFSAAWKNRQVYLTESQEFFELVAADLIAEGKFLYYKADGAIGIRDIPVLSSQTGSYAVTDASLIGPPTIELFGKIGVTNIYEFEYDYNWSDDKYYSTLLTRDVASVSAFGERRAKTFKWPTTERQTFNAGPTRAELEDLAQSFFDIYATNVYLIECPCNISHIEDEIGDVASLTISELPNPKTGLNGISAWGAMLIGRRVSPMRGEVVLQFVTRGDEL